MESAPGAEADRGLVRAHGRNNGIYDLEGEAGAVLDRAAVLIRTLVRHCLQELVDEIAIRAVDFNTVETGLDGILGRVGVPPHVFFDLC